MLFLVVARDGSDPEASARRAAVRPAHLESAQQLHEAGRLRVAGALLNGGEKAVGSALLLEAQDEAAARALIEEDVYFREGVWSSYDIWPFRQAF
jgi:uncharacterized protein YciI